MKKLTDNVDMYDILLLSDSVIFKRMTFVNVIDFGIIFLSMFLKSADFTTQLASRGTKTAEYIAKTLFDPYSIILHLKKKLIDMTSFDEASHATNSERMFGELYSRCTIIILWRTYS